MTANEIIELTRKLTRKYPDGGYVSCATIYSHAVNDGTISKETWDEARKYYGRLWNYTGD